MYQIGVQIRKQGQILKRNGTAQCNVERECDIGCAKTAEPIELPSLLFGTVNEMGQRNLNTYVRADWCHLAKIRLNATDVSEYMPPRWRCGLFPNYFVQKVYQIVDQKSKNTSKWFFSWTVSSTLVVGGLALWQRRSSHERSCSTLSPVSTGMGARFWTGILPWYVTKPTR